jgi:hypothetical protein
MTLEDFLGIVTRDAEILKSAVVGIFALVVGWWYLFSAGFRLLKWSDQKRTYGWPSVIARCFIGACLINASTYVNSMVVTVTGEPPVNAMSVMPASAGGSGPAGMIMAAVLAWVAALGVIAILRGSMLIVKSADGQQQGQDSHSDPVWVGLVFIVSGSVGVNLWRFTSGLI